MTEKPTANRVARDVAAMYAPHVEQAKAAIRQSGVASRLATTANRIGFRVDGTPAPKGSARAIRRGAFAVLVASGSDGNKRALTAWAAAVAWSARARHVPMLAGPIAVDVTFYVARPRTVRREYPEVKPDLDKLLRATLDPLTGIAWTDDGQVVDAVIRKRYAVGGSDGGEPGAWIEIYRMTTGEAKP